MNRFKQITLITLGLISTGLGALGAFVPGLPTTPFVLLASWLFYRSSPRLQAKLLASWLSRYIRNYERDKGMTKQAKASAIVLMAGMVCLSTFVFIPKGSVARIIVPIAGAIGCLVVAFVVPKAKHSPFRNTEGDEPKEEPTKEGSATQAE